MSIFTKTYELSLTRRYVSHWGMTQAVRELQVFDFERWYTAPLDTRFSDHNGREIT